jgi:hypothetical protein
MSKSAILDASTTAMEPTPSTVKILLPSTIGFYSFYLFQIKEIGSDLDW